MFGILVDGFSLLVFCAMSVVTAIGIALMYVCFQNNKMHEVLLLGQIGASVALVGGLLQYWRFDGYSEWYALAGGFFLILGYVHSLWTILREDLCVRQIFATIILRPLCVYFGWPILVLAVFALCSFVTVTIGYLIVSLPAKLWHRYRWWVGIRHPKQIPPSMTGDFFLRGMDEIKKAVPFLTILQISIFSHSYLSYEISMLLVQRAFFFFWFRLIGRKGIVA